MAKVLVAGMGNVLLKDEGIGVHVARALGRRSLPEGVEVVELGTSWEGLLALADGAGKLVIVDAMAAGLEPGTVLRFRPDDLERRPALLSAHDLGIWEALKLAELSGRGPREVVILGVEVGEVGVGCELSSALRGRFEEIVGRVMEEVVKDAGG